MTAVAILAAGLAACGSSATSSTVSGTSSPSPQSSSTPKSTFATLVPSGTLAPSATTSVTFSGERSGPLAALSPLCNNQYPGVQTTGTLNGKFYMVSVSDPTAADYAQGSWIRVDEYDGDTNTGNIIASWVGGSSSSVTNYNAAKGAKFSGQLHPETGMNPQGATTELDVTGAIVC